MLLRVPHASAHRLRAGHPRPSVLGPESRLLRGLAFGLLPTLALWAGVIWAGLRLLD